MMHPDAPAGPTFDGLGLSPKLLELLATQKLVRPTPIQHQAIPVGLEGKDMIGIAQTGTGKTLSFGLPLLQRLVAHGGRALILLPTRELAYQVEEALEPFAKPLGIGTVVFVGGASMIKQRADLRRNPRILIATPGRLNDHLEQRTVVLNEVKILVLDEADRMLDMGFKPQIDRILRHVPKERQTLLFSATMPQEIAALARNEMKLPLRIEVAPAGTTAERVEQEVIVVYRDEKYSMLVELMKENEGGSVLVFSRTKHGAKKLTHQLILGGFKAAEIHANRSLAQRRAALEGFKAGTYRILVATDIAARGIDVTGIALVVNFDLPDDPADYVHRIGRTARAGRQGKAVSFALPDQMDSVRSIERLIRAEIPRRHRPGLPMPTVAQRGSGKGSSHSPSQGNRGGGGGGGSRGRRGGGSSGGRRKWRRTSR